jgi:peptide/nickel transport system substrate-binding protein
MFRNRRRARLTRVAVAGAAALLAVGIAACSSSGSAGGTSTSASASASATGAKVAGGTATVALPAGVTPNWIFPYVPLSNASEYNANQFFDLMYRPLYMFGNNGSSVDVNYPLSPANAPVYTDGGKTVTITMKDWKWSNGESVSAKDVIFFLNMFKAEPQDFYGYVPGLLPDNLTSYSATSANTVVLHTKSAVSSIWFTYNQLAELTPMPMAWDVTSASAKAGSGGCTTDTAADKFAKCTAVYNFLIAQAKNAKTYATNPIWAVTDGPWKLSQFSTASSGVVTTFVPSPTYSGSPKPSVSKVVFQAYTDDSTEYTALKTGSVDVGYIPTQDLSAVSGSQILPSTNPLGSGYNLQPAYAFGIQYININLNNPTIGPAFRQLYVRQAMQELVDQEGMIKSVDRGYGYPTSGAVPTQPKSQWVSSAQEANGGQGPYPFSVANATKLLTSHGWKNVGGVMTCQSAGTAATDCGAGVKAGTKLNITMDYATGVQSFQEEVAIMKSDFGQAGIKMNLVPQSFNTIIGNSSPCKPTQSSCTWDMLNYGGWNFNGPGDEPTGEPLYATGAGSNSGSYSDPQMDKLIGLTHTSSSLSVFQQYANYAAQQLPGVLWDPNAYSVGAVTSKLANVTSNPLATFLPEYWNFTK